MEDFKIYDYYPPFKEGELISVQVPNNRIIKGNFISWKDRVDRVLGKMLVIEKTYESYILLNALLLNDNSITIENFMERIKKKNYENRKKTFVSDKVIFRINGKPFKRPTL